MGNFQGIFFKNRSIHSEAVYLRRTKISKTRIHFELT